MRCSSKINDWQHDHNDQKHENYVNYMVMLHATNWMTINVNNTGNRLKTGAVNGPENTSHSIKRGIESCKTETAGYTSLDIGYQRSPGRNRCKIAFANLVIHESRVSERTFVIASTERNSFVSALIRV